MSLIYQIRIAFFLVILATAGGSLVFSTMDSKHYLEDELQKKNVDNANVLALSMSQMDKDPTTIDLFISAQFDAGHYRYIGLFDPNGKAITERINPNSKSLAPNWFIKLMPINVTPGFANIESGWIQYGTLNVESDVSFAYDQLWSTVKNLLIWVLSIGLITYIVSGQLLRKILSPLDEVITQAKALGERRFISVKEPKTMEFKAVVQEMNLLSHHIKHNLNIESERLDELRIKANYDDLTGLMNRVYFSNSVQSKLLHEDFSQGALVQIKLSNLAEMNAQLGYSHTNALLKKICSAIDTLCQKSTSMIAGRLSGTDFAVFCGQPIDEYALANSLKESILLEESASVHPAYSMVTTKTKKMDEIESLFKVLQFILDLSNLNEDSHHRIINATEVVASKNLYLTEWRTMLSNALAHQRIKLEHYPVINTSGDLIHYESPVRLQLEPEGKWLPAGEFINWAIQLDLIKTMDALVLKTAVNLLNQQQKPICLNVSESTMNSLEYMESAVALLSKTRHPELLSFEVSEIAVFNHLEQFRQFSQQLKALGCQVGIEHVCLRISRLGELHDMGLDYIKFDTSLIRGINHNETNKSLLRGLCMIAHSIGMLAIAEGVQTQDEIATLNEIGMDGVTGPYIKYQET